MKLKIIICILLGTLSALAQTNEPVIQVKQYRPDFTNQINLGTRSAPRRLHGVVEAVYKTKFGLTIDDPSDSINDGKDIIIQNCPYLQSLAMGQEISLYAEKIGTIRAANEDGTPSNGEVLELWDYYTPPVPTAEQIAAAKAAQEKAKADAKAKAEAAKKAGAVAALKFNQDAAAKGDAYGLLRMGERYRDGDGVEKDLAKAKEYLQKAADAGDPTAAEELSKLKQ